MPPHRHPAQIRRAMPPAKKKSSKATGAALPEGARHNAKQTYGHARLAEHGEHARARASEFCTPQGGAMDLDDAGLDLASAPAPAPEPE